jgi:ribosomal protein S18 acetylase RimI-like enzyme
MQCRPVLPDEGDVATVRFEPAHVDGVCALARAEGWPTFSDPSRVLSLWTAPGVTGVVALRRGSVVGGAHLLCDGYHAYLTFLAVDASARRAGVGRRLVEAAFEASGAVRMDILSTPEAEPFYAAHRHHRLPGFRLHPSRFPDNPG